MDKGSNNGHQDVARLRDALEGVVRLLDKPGVGYDAWSCAYEARGAAEACRHVEDLFLGQEVPAWAIARPISQAVATRAEIAMLIEKQRELIKSLERLDHWIEQRRLQVEAKLTKTTKEVEA